MEEDKQVDDRSPLHLLEITKEAFEKTNFDDIQFIKTQLSINLSFASDKQLILDHIVKQLKKHQESCKKEIVVLLQGKKEYLANFSQKLEKIKRHISILEELYESLYSYIKTRSINLQGEFLAMRKEMKELDEIRKEQERINAVLILHGMLKEAKIEFNKLSSTKCKEEVCASVSKILKKIKRSLGTILQDAGEQEKSEFAIAKNIKIEADLLEEKHMAILESLLKNLDLTKTNSDNEKILYHLLKAFKSLGQQTKLYEWVRQKYIAALSSQLIEKIQEKKGEYLQKAKNSNEGEELEPPLKEYYNEIYKLTNHQVIRSLLQITTPKLVLIKSMKELKYFVSGYDFILHGIWEQVQNDLAFKQGSMFTSAIPKVMQANYMLTVKFLNDLSKLTNKKFMQYSLVKKFIDRFEFKSYFQVHYMKISKQVESIFSTTSDLVKFNDKILPVIENLFSDSVYITEIGTKFLTLSIQVLNRYGSYLQKISSGSVGKSSGDSFIIIEEIIATSEYLKNIFLPLLLNKLHTSNKDKLEEALKKLIKEILQKLDKVMSPYIETFKYEVSTIVLQNADSIRSLVPMYRMDDNPFNGQPSTFASAVFRPLLTLLSQPTLRKIPKVIRTKA